jgi:exonuclease III
MAQSKQENILKVGFMNIRGQTGLTSTRQIQIESFIIREKLDILHLQEISITEESFTSCNTISSSFSIISNNAVNKYGTVTIIKSDFSPENILFDTKGRVIVFDIGGITLAKLVDTFNMKDSFRILHPKSPSFSHFYNTIHQGEGATRLDRSYS